MRKWQDLAAPDDPASWYSVGRMWPTRRGTYETADFSTGTSKSATGATPVLYAFCASTLSGLREYVVDSAKIWQYTGGSLVDRTNGMTVGTLRNIQMAQYGDVTIMVNGTSTATIFSTGTTFSALSGAPKGRIVCVCANSVLILNTDTAADEFRASDVGDYTNWTTGEAVNRRIIELEGPILAAVSWGGSVYVFKKSGIIRLTYVGGDVKWRSDVVWRGLGCNENSYSGGQYQAVATRHGIVFNANQSASGNSVYLFDGASPPVCLNPLTTLDSSYGVYLYNPIDDVLTIAPALGSDENGTEAASGAASLYYYFSFESGAWGSGIGAAEEDYEATTTFPQAFPNGVLQGDYYARAESSSKPVYWRYRNITTGAFYRCAPSAPGSAATCFLQTSKFGTEDRKTQFNRVAAKTRRRTDLGTDSASLELTLFREIDDTSAQTTRTISESSDRKRFDLVEGANVDCYARVKITWTALDMEVDDFKVYTKDAGAN